MLYQDYRVFGIEIYRTDICGEITITINKNLKISKKINNV